jgi:hypothetical protein
VAFLLEALANGPQKCEDLKKLAEIEGIAARTLRSVREKLGVLTEKEKRTMDGAFYWRLPDKAPEPSDAFGTMRLFEPEELELRAKMGMMGKIDKNANIDKMHLGEVDEPIVLSPLDLHLDYDPGISPLDAHLAELGVLDHHGKVEGKIEGRVEGGVIGWRDPDGVFDEDAMLAQGWRKVDGDWWVFPPSVAA